MKFLDGLKTIVGAVGLTVSVVAPHLSNSVQDVGGNVIQIAQGAFGLLFALGLIHKREKSQQ